MVHVIISNTIYYYNLCYSLIINIKPIAYWYLPNCIKTLPLLLRQHTFQVHTTL
jgi:hypothetical protein